MRKMFSFVFSLLMIGALASCTGNKNQSEKPADVQDGTECAASGKMKLKNGVNVSHWLSQSDKRGEERSSQITKKDFDSIAAMGFDFVRIPVDEMHVYDENMNRDEEGFRLLNNAIGWALENDLSVVVDLHVVRSFHFNSENDRPNTLFTDMKEQDKICDIWRDLQKDLSKYPTDKVAYEILNEPVAPKAEDWNNFVAKVVSAIRETEKDRNLVVGSNKWQIPYTFDSLVVPANDKNIILSFHFYEPHLVTHYRAPWTAYKDYDGKVSYPGRVIEDTSVFANYDGELPLMLRGMNEEYSKDIMYQKMKLAIDMADSLGLQLFCGEFGAYPYYVDEAVRLQWYKDMADIFRQYNIANCHWCYKGDFPLVKEDGSPNELPAILTRK